MWHQIIRLAVFAAGFLSARASITTSTSDLHDRPVLEPEFIWDLSGFPNSQPLRLIDYTPLVNLQDVHAIHYGQLPESDMPGHGFYALHLDQGYENAYFAQSDKDMQKIKRMFKIGSGESHPLYIGDGFPKLCLLKAVPKGYADEKPEAFRRWLEWKRRTEGYYDIAHRIHIEELLVSLLRTDNEVPLRRRMTQIPQIRDIEVYKATVVAPDVGCHLVGHWSEEFVLTPQHLQSELYSNR